jgi:hypothetical protein
MTPGGSDPLERVVGGAANLKSIRTALRSLRLELRLDRVGVLEEGRTAARVAVAMLRTEPGAKRPSAPRCVIKYRPTGREVERESRTHLAALDSAGAFEPWLIRMLDVGPIPLDDGGILMLYEYAGARTARSLLGRAGLPDLCATVTRGVLDTWNPGCGDREEPVSAVLKAMLQGRLEPDRPLHDWLAARPALAAEHLTTVLADGTTHANPCALIGGRFDDILISTMHGHVHGDLHLSNIMLTEDSWTGDPGHYRLIDLGDYAAEAPLARDPAHLVLAIVAEHLDGMGSPGRTALAEALIAPARTTRVPVEVRDVAAATYDAGLAWAAKMGRNVDWREQWLLGYVAGGLAFAGRDGLADGGAEWFFELAARAATAFLELFGSPVPRFAPAVPPAAPAASAASASVPSAAPDRALSATDPGVPGLVPAPRPAAGPSFPEPVLAVAAVLLGLPLMQKRKRWNQLLNAVSAPLGVGHGPNSTVPLRDAADLVSWCARLGPYGGGAGPAGRSVEDRWARLLAGLRAVRQRDDTVAAALAEHGFREAADSPARRG